jgi:hypothetical protein
VRPDEDVRSGVLLFFLLVFVYVVGIRACSR